MPTPSQVAGRAQTPPPERHYIGSVTTAGNPLTVALEPGGARTKAAVLDGKTYAVGARVLVLVTAVGNWVVGGAGSAPAPATYPVTDFSASFAITGSVTNPTKGSSNYFANYTTIDKQITYEFYVQLGANFQPGSGTYTFNVPVPASGTSAIFAQAVGSAWIWDQGTAYENGTVEFASTSGLYITMKNGALLGSAGPGTPWAPADQMRGSITYWKA
jgi:hypothetical protein